MQYLLWLFLKFSTRCLIDQILIDATNSYRQVPEPYLTVYHCLADNTKGEIVKCFNSTGFENILNPLYNGLSFDLFMAGDSAKAKEAAIQLSLDAGFGRCFDFGKSDKVELLEKYALSWINPAIIQDQGRNIAFKVIRRWGHNGTQHQSAQKLNLCKLSMLIIRT